MTFDPDLDPDVAAAARQVFDAAARLETVGLRVERTDLEGLWRPTPVTEELMSALAAMTGASEELQGYAERVRNGECPWDRIESLARPVPPEVAALKASPSYLWNWDPRPQAPPVRSPKPRGDDGVVGPSDWPDDFDDYPAQRRWYT
ncbi:hypothetical protein NDR87_05030 [Nocardia sp. CDC159]|uniref:Uncharacterized protein n=1 Tax=Nocardia pulmonis TaxID=2951408 RepID=A0A9X2E2C6_9NOCA|nr:MULTISPECIES: hypothetical protein [Nocardia]MCM6772977.1 hypothetical protein [Nocardia pulmonis]MCM6785720.1 hypothetical protein [Nocardia sp. CDC159]